VLHSRPRSASAITLAVSLRVTVGLERKSREHPMKGKRKSIAIKKSTSHQQSATRARSVNRNLGPSRDFQGYGPHPPHAHWPGDARIAVNLNLNVEAGGERCMMQIRFPAPNIEWQASGAW